jgi:hypothetical protein
MLAFLWSPDTKPDAGLWVETKPGTSEVQLKEEIREFVIQVDAQMKGLPAEDFVFGYPITEESRKPGEPRPCFLAMPTKSGFRTSNERSSRRQRASNVIFLSTTPLPATS